MSIAGPMTPWAVSLRLVLTPGSAAARLEAVVSVRAAARAIAEQHALSSETPAPRVAARVVAVLRLTEEKR